MRSRPTASPSAAPAFAPDRLLLLVAVGSVLALLGLAHGSARGTVPARPWPRPLQASADSDSVALGTLSDSLADDSLRRLADPAAADTDSVAVRYDRVERYLRRPSDRRTSALFPRARRPLAARLGTYWKHQLQVDSTFNRYTAAERVGDADVRYPVAVDATTYRRARLEHDLLANWRDLAEQRQRQRQRRSRGGLGFNVVVPGGRNSAFTTIFGKPEVDLRVNGQADIRAGFDYRKSDQQVAVTGRASQVDPDFKQDLRLGITGSIGDKMRIDVNYDSNNQFDFQNQLKLHYTGYEDEIIQSIEAGNVFLQTPSRLIRGGQSLFGIKSQLQIGGVTLTTVASQQEGQANSLSIDGGSETTTFDLKPTDYDDDQHFFLAYYFRNRWEDALSRPPTVVLANGFDRISDIEVWRLERNAPEDENLRQIVALADLGESGDILEEANGYTAEVLPDYANPAKQQYDASTLETLRDPDTLPASFLETQGLTASDFQTGSFKKLRRGVDFDLDETLGYLSLNQSLQDNEAVAVAFRYVAGGQTFQVGDFSTETGGSTGGQNSQRLITKLLRPANLKQPAPETGFNPAVWYLQLRNIYRLPGRGLQAGDFDLQIYYEPSGQPEQKTLPGVSGQRTVLQMLGLDRLNEDGAERPDDRFDYLTNFTILPGDGLLIFPYLEPFGRQIARQVDAAGGSDADKEGWREDYVFESLYTQKRANARRDTRKDVYRIRGSYKGSVQSFYDLRAYAGLVPGSVRVTSGGTPLAEGADFTVDYQGGTLTITNPAYLTAGRNIEISYEQNSFFNLQKKTLLGARADYALGERLGLGATVMRLSQKSPVDKFRIGEEPIQNTIWGLDGAVNLEPRWLTRAVDALPLVQTKAPSSISFSGEFAQLRPGHTETVAFERTRRELRDDGYDFNSDELRGLSFVDDFEGFENTFSLKQPGSWLLAAAPDSIGAIDAAGRRLDAASDSLRTTWRGNFGWYRLNANVLNDLGVPVVDGGPTDIVEIREVFPNRDTRGELDQTLETLDIYFNPRERGPYNYTTDLRSFLDRPRDVWGGMTQRLPEGFNDFSLKNIEFVEFVFRPFAENEANEAGRDARLLVDLGSISEDVLPNEQLNNEDGLSLTSVGESSVQTWGRTPNGLPNNAVDVDEGRRTEDLGLDGLASYGDAPYPDFATEQTHFAGFLAALEAAGDTRPAYQAELAKARRDPSGDDYYYFGNRSYFEDETYYPGGASIQQRFSRYFAGHELNSFEGQNRIANNSDSKRGNSKYPDTEDLNLNATVDTDNSYFQYEVPLSLSELRDQARPEAIGDYVVTELADDQGRGTGWYQVRIPIRDYTRKVGDIENFSLIESIRLWITGTEVPVTVRFATLELVGSQWRQAETVPLEYDTPTDTLADGTRVSISSINNEENADVYRSPNGTIVSQTRLATGQTQNSREQALTVRVEDLAPGAQRAISRTYNQGVDLLKYENVRMFVHMHGEVGGQDLLALPPGVAREKVKLFVRLGANESDAFYEYEQPLTPSDPLSGNADELWQTNQPVGNGLRDLNSVNIVLAALNQLKVARDNAGAARDSVYWSDLNDVPINPPVENFAPAGTRLGIKGTPSLGRIQTIVIGLRNTTTNELVDDVTVWVNELRVSGYDEGNGWSGLANADIRLADLARIQANIQTQTDGFGSLSSSLGEREQNNVQNWSVTTGLNLEKLVPEKYGWQVPVSVQVQQNTSTPRFSPNRGDVRLDEIVAQIEEDDALTPEEQATEKDAVVRAAQNHSQTSSYTVSVAKRGSRSRLLRNTVDGLSVSYSYTDTEARSPSQERSNSWRWSGNTSYRLSMRKPRTIKPFWFLDPIPLIGTLGDLRFNYLPQSLSTSLNATRSYSQTKDRNTLTTAETAALETPESIRFPLREQQAFTVRRNFSLQHNPFGFLNLSFDTNTNQSLNAAGVDTTFSSIVREEDGTETVYQGESLQQLIDRQVITPEDVDVRAFETRRLGLRPLGDVAGTFFSGGDGIRTNRHEQRFTATFRPNMGDTKAFDWVNVQDVVYGVQYSWDNGPVGRLTGASVRNQVDLRGGLTLRPQDLWRKFEFYRDLEAAQKAHEAEKRSARNRRAQERERAREQEGEETADAETDAEAEREDDDGPSLPLPNLRVLMRRTALAVTGMRDFTVNYTGTRSAASSNVGRLEVDELGRPFVTGGYSLLDAVRGDGPPLGYRFGLQRRIPLNDRLSEDATLQISDVLGNTNRLQGRTALNPSSALTVNLSWNLDWNTNETFTFNPVVDGVVDTVRTETGTQKASVWALGADYLDLFRQQLATFEADLAANEGLPGQPLGDADGDGRIVLTNGSVVDDFRGAFLLGGGSLGSRGLLPFPLPGWSVNYTGIGQWPLVRRIVRSATLRHVYSADYSTDFKTNLIDPESESARRTFALAGQPVGYTIPRTEIGNTRVNERFSPLIGLDLSWKGRLQTNVSWNKSNAYSLSTSNFEVSENTTNELTMTASYQKTGMRIPFVPGKKLNNRVSFSLTLSRSKTDDERFSLRRALEDALTRADFETGDALRDDNVSVVTAYTRTTVSPQVSYQFSNRVSANFTLRYEKFNSEDNRQPSSTNVNGTFNIRVSIAN